MRIDIHRGRQLRALIVSTSTVMVLGLLADTLITAAQTSSGDAKVEAQRAKVEAVVTVQGMQCPFCAYGIKKHLAKVAGVTQVDVELAKNQAIVAFAPDAEVTDLSAGALAKAAEQIRQAIRKAGFTLEKIEWRSGGKTEPE